jgi:DNA modification methylase
MKVNLNEIKTSDSQLEPEQAEVVRTLSESMKEIGLSHPVILRKCSPDEHLKAKYVPVSGERRIRAARLLGWLIIEAEVRDINEHDGKIVRLHENLRRYNLPWHEQVQLVEELHVLRQVEHGMQDTGRPKKGEEKEGWSLRDTAKELNIGLGNLSEDILLSRALREDPNLAKVKDKRTAIKLARITIGRAQVALASGAPQSGLRASMGLEVDQIYMGDSADILKQLPEDSVDHCITDPPWIRFYDASLRIDQRTVPVIKELYRVLKPGAMLYLFAGMDDIYYYTGYNLPGQDGNPAHMPGVLEKIGFNVATTPVIWQKEKSLSRRGVRPWEYDKDFEFIIVACKGDGVLTSGTTLSGIKSFPIVPSPSLVHPNEKPINLIADIINDCSHENNVIIDPFAGSGVLGSACKRENRRYILIERDKAFYDQIVQRVGGKNG